ncbi:hypothetical protein ACPPVT_07325 [Angustibacter sp. McL0619]|uniref:hypothetical protein n=1 Tax=Angustibacter sp. McL0619 TaxID=3415676 RepID=UPI003CF06118
MGEFAGLIEKLSDETLDGLDADIMGVHNLRNVVALLRLVRRDLEAGESLSPDEITQGVRGEILSANFANQIDELVNGMTQYGEQTPNPLDQRAAFQRQAENLRNQVIERLRPIVRTDEAEMRQVLASAAAMLVSLHQDQEELAKQRTALAQNSAATASEDLAGFYKAQAQGHATSARTFLVAGAVAAIVLTALTVIFLFVAPPDYTATDTSEQWIEVARNTVGRLALLSIAGFAVAFCARNYRVNMHLEVLNKRRENALNTFGLMQAAVVSDAARDVVVAELVRAVFTSEETGYLGADTERTVIEQPGGAGMLSAVSAMARGSS